MLIVVPTILAIISFLIVALRLYTRFVLIKNVGPDDWLIGVSIVSLKIAPFDVLLVCIKELILNCEIVCINYTSRFHYPWYVPRLSNSLIKFILNNMKE